MLSICKRRLWIHVTMCIECNNISTTVWHVRWHNNRDASRQRHWHPAVAGDQAEWKAAPLAGIHPPCQHSSHIPPHPGTPSSLRCRSVCLLRRFTNVTLAYCSVHAIRFHVYCILSWFVRYLYVCFSSRVTWKILHLWFLSRLILRRFYNYGWWHLTSSVIYLYVTELMRSPTVRWSSRSCRSLPPTPTPSYHHPLHPPLPAVGMVAERKKRFELWISVLLILLD